MGLIGGMRSELVRRSLHELPRGCVHGLPCALCAIQLREGAEYECLDFNIDLHDLQPGCLACVDRSPPVNSKSMI